MNTFAYDFFQSIPNRWAEIDILAEEAKKNSDNEKVYNVLCRSAVVLTSANLEGFIKEAVKVILNDINKFSKFRNAPTELKMTFCSSFIDIENKGGKANELIKVLDELDTKFLLQPFLFENNKNPSPSVIDKMCLKFGVNNFFESIEKSKVNIVFENDSEETEKLISNLSEQLLMGCKEYPYSININEFNIDLSAKKGKKGLFQTFLDELLRKRNSIAHGTSLENEVSPTEILEMKQKVQILEYVLAMILLKKSIKEKKEQDN